MRSKMRFFLFGLGHGSNKEIRAAILIDDMTIPRLTSNMKQLELEKLRDIEEYRNKKDKTRNDSG